MIGALFGSGLAINTARSFARPLAYLGAALAILLAVWLVIGWDAARIEKARADATQVERERWQAEIARSNAAIAEAALAAERAAREADARATDEITALRKTLDDLERKNAAAPEAGRCGLSRPRDGLLR